MTPRQLSIMSVLVTERPPLKETPPKKITFPSQAITVLTSDLIWPTLRTPQKNTFASLCLEFTDLGPKLNV